jgi:DNA gyrase inhibitor GyrI
MPEFSVSESIEIHEKATDVYEYLREFKNWPEWSPWLICDPESTVSFGNSSYSWNGKFVGVGSMETEKETPHRQIDYLLAFKKPFKSKATVTLSIEENGESSMLTWSMKSKLPFFLFWMKSTMAQLVAMDYQRGLKMLKEQLEEGRVHSVLDFVGEQEISGTHYIGVERHCAISAMETAMEEDFGKLMDWVKKADASTLPEETRKPFTIYEKWDLAKGLVSYRVCHSLRDSSVDAPYGFVSGERPSCKAYVVGHTGAYRHLGNAWSAAMLRSRAKLFKQSKSMKPFEKYVTMPDERGEKETITLVCLPLK